MASAKFKITFHPRIFQRFVLLHGAFLGTRVEYHESLSICMRELGTNELGFFDPLLIKYFFYL